MNYEDNHYAKKAEKKKITVIIITAIIVTFVFNGIMYAVISQSMQKKLDKDFQTAMDSLDDRIDDALANRLTTKISEMVSDNITDEVTQSATILLGEYITEEVIDNFKREYNLPEGYFSVGLKAAENVDSVLEVKASSSSSSSSSQATAFIINQQGYAITNAHVVTYEETIYQNLGGFRIPIGTETKVYTTIKANYRNSSQEYQMQVIDYDIEKDLAIIKFVNPPAKLKSVTFGDADLVNLGEEVATIGNAQGLGISLTTGVVSNTPRSYKTIRVLQTNTTINPGNSGGPLFNIYGEVVGVVSFKIIESMVNEGLGFAICSNSVIDYIEHVKSQKKININYSFVAS
ncbi:MAG: trypsin-like peptidase domain-containing protein [Clostridia bacterium]|jgi:S1-C subfamily serine protease|nr:trypsin-like serine protease [Clostridiales bacterium]